MRRLTPAEQASRAIAVVAVGIFVALILVAVMSIAWGMLVSASAASFADAQHYAGRLPPKGTGSATPLIFTPWGGNR